MTLINFAIGALTVAILAVMSRRFALRTAGRTGGRLPLLGSVEGSAPKWLVLSVMPTVAALVIVVALIGLSRFPVEEQAEGGLMLAVIALAFIAAHAFHLLRLSERY